MSIITGFINSSIFGVVVIAAIITAWVGMGILERRENDRKQKRCDTIYHVGINGGQVWKQH